MRFLPAILLAAALLALPASAGAVVCDNQPGQGAIDQYCEIVPSGGGARPDRTPPTGTTALPQSTQDDLQAAGTDGARVQALAQTSPAPTSATGTATPTPSSPAGQTAPASPGATGGTTPTSTSNRRAAEASSGTLDAVFGDLTGGSTGRDWVPWALVAVATGAGAAAWLSRGRWS